MSGAPDADAIRTALDRDGYTLVRGFASSDEIAAARARIAEAFRPGGDEKLDPGRPELIMRNVQRLVVGGVGGVGLQRPRLLRTFYNPMWEPDHLGMRALFSRLIRLRNEVYGLPADYALADPQDGLWTCSRVHHYPAGGGFMAAHPDAVLGAVAAAHALPRYVQLGLLLTTKGDDFSEGGAFIDVEGGRVMLEDDATAGDVVVYDGRIVHGVADIDPLDPFDLASLRGRMVAFVSLYELQADRTTGAGSGTRGTG